jgi:hypothetical protein
VISDQFMCPECGGEGWAPVARERCCGNAEWECGATGCTGPTQEWEQEQCEYCLGSGTVAESGEEPPPFDDALLASAMSAFGQDAEERLEAKPASAVDAEGSETPKGPRR